MYVVKNKEIFQNKKGLFGKLEHGIKNSVSNVVLDVKALNA